MERRQEKKFTVVDTSAMIGRPDVINLIDGQVFVPLTVIKQLDGLKNSEAAEKRKNVRRASNFIEAGIKEKKISVLTKFDPIDGLDNASDNKIVGAAVRLKKENPDAEVSLLATDRNMRIVAAAHGIEGKEKVYMKKTRIFKIRAGLGRYSSYVLPRGGVALVISLIILSQEPGDFLMTFGGCFLLLAIILIATGIVAGVSGYWPNKEHSSSGWDDYDVKRPPSRVMGKQTLWGHHLYTKDDPW